MTRERDWDEPLARDDLAESHWSTAQLRAGDTVTNTVEESAAFERARAQAFNDYDAIHDGEWRTR